MIDEQKIAFMAKLAIMENKEGMDLMRVISHRKIDYVLTEIFRGAIAGTSCYVMMLVLWFCYIWDGLNDFVVGLDLVQLLIDIAFRYIIFIAIYLVICAVVALRRYKKRMDQRYDYLSCLKELKYTYYYDRKPVAEDSETDKGKKGGKRRQEDV